MKEFRLSVISLIIYLTVFFNIERLDIGNENFININSFVYILVIVAIFIVILSKKIADLSPIYGFSLWLGIYFLIKLVFFKEQSFFQGSTYFYLTITEISFLSIALLLGRITSKLLYDLESTVKNITLIGTDDRVKSFEEAAEDIQLEMYRSRRFNSELSVITFSVEKNFDQITINSIVRELQEDILKHYSVILVAKTIQNHSRRTDKILVKLGKDQVVLLAPHTSKKDAEKLMSQLNAELNKKINNEIPFSIKTFPEDGHTFEELYKLSNTELKTDQ